jgi:hypothetical protein
MVYFCFTQATMKKKKIILKPKRSVGDLFKQVAEDKATIQKAISEGKEKELKGKFKFVKTI